MNQKTNNSELMFGLVTPVGINYKEIESTLSNHLNQFKYELVPIKLSSLLKGTLSEFLDTELIESPEYNRIDSYMTAGNEARSLTERKDILTALAVTKIQDSRENSPDQVKEKAKSEKMPFSNKVHLFCSLKHPDEVKLLRKLYGDGFYLISVTSSRKNRLEYLTGEIGMEDNEAEHLIKRDESESDESGQHTRDAFHLADCFIDIDTKDFKKQLERFLKLIFRFPYETPSRDEYAMFLAFAASLRSGDLSRQIGAVITSPYGEIIATGANDVPCFGGGLYWPDKKRPKWDQRDFVRKHDSNEKSRDEIVTKIINAVQNGIFENLSSSEIKKIGKDKLTVKKEWFKETGILDITEYGRAVHAEMEALLSCARSGVSPRDGTVYSTTFPCHNCAKHIVASGIKRVVFVEPYPKSQAKNLHSDSICLLNEEDDSSDKKVSFVPFVGIGPRRFFDLFSMKLSSGSSIKRKQNGETIEWKKSNSSIRVPMEPVSYIEREFLTVEEINLVLQEKKDAKKKR